MNNMVDNIKNLLPLGAILVTTTAWGVVNFATGEKNDALTNQRLDQLIEVVKEDKQSYKQDYKALVVKVDTLTAEVNRLTFLVDRADKKGLLGQAKTQTFLSMAAPSIAAITPTPPQIITYQTTLMPAKAADTITPSPTVTEKEPKPTPKSKPTPRVCVLGLCVKG